MRVFLFLVFLLSFFTGCNIQKQNQNNFAVKQENQDPYAWDFGRVKEGQILRHTFVFKNDSHKAIEIKDVDTSCDCTASDLEDKTLAPGRQTLMKVSFNTKGYSGPTQQYIYVRTNNHDKPVVRFIIKANVARNK